MNILTMFLLCSVLAATPVVAETLYKSVGKDGKITYSDKPPAEDRIEKTIRSANLPNTALPASTDSYVEQLRKKKGLENVVEDFLEEIERYMREKAARPKPGIPTSA